MLQFAKVFERKIQKIFWGLFRVSYGIHYLRDYPRGIDKVYPKGTPAVYVLVIKLGF